MAPATSQSLPLHAGSSAGYLHSTCLGTSTTNPSRELVELRKKGGGAGVVRCGFDPEWRLGASEL